MDQRLIDIQRTIGTGLTLNMVESTYIKKLASISLAVLILMHSNLSLDF